VHNTIYIITHMQQTSVKLSMVKYKMLFFGKRTFIPVIGHINSLNYLNFDKHEKIHKFRLA
jgi:hypothetical protein